MTPSELVEVLDGNYSSWTDKFEMWECINAIGAKLSKDGNKWSFLWGEDLQEGVAGFGDTVRDAALDFFKNVCNETIKSYENENY